MEQSVLDILKEQLEVLKIGYVALLNDKDVLLNWGKPQLEALYNTRVGIHKIELLKLQLSIKALKRKLELVRSAINTNQKIDFAEIELTIAIELANVQEQIMIESNKVLVGKKLLANLDSPQRSSDLRNIFRSLAKELHPDVNPNLTKEQQDIWQMVLDAYNFGDIDKLKAISLVYEKEIRGTEKEYTEAEISLVIESIKEGCKVLQNEIDEIKGTFPFTIENEIKDEEWVKNENDKTNKDLLSLKEYEFELESEYKMLIELYE